MIRKISENELKTILNIKDLNIRSLKKDTFRFYLHIIKIFVDICNNKNIKDEYYHF